MPVLVVLIMGQTVQSCVSTGSALGLESVRLRVVDTRDLEAP